MQITYMILTRRRINRVMLIACVECYLMREYSCICFVSVRVVYPLMNLLSFSVVVPVDWPLQHSALLLLSNPSVVQDVTNAHSKRKYEDE